MGRWTSLPVGALLLAALAGTLYGPRLGHEFVTDDAIYISENPAVIRGAPLTAFFVDRSTVASDPEFQWQSYRPLRTLAFRAIARVAGVRPLAFGLTNLGLYVTAAVLIVVLARRLGVSSVASLAATAVWVAAPVHVEPVLYASALGDHLSLVLELLALLLALRRRMALALLSVPLAFMAMLAKEMAITAPVLVAILLWSTGATRRRSVLLVAAHGAAALLFLVVRTAVLHAFGHAQMTGASVLLGAAMIPVRLVAYLRIVLEPLGHSAGYVLPPPSWPIVAGAWVALAFTVFALQRAPQISRVGAAWFALALLPVLGVVPVLANLADRFALLPSVGLVLALPPAAALLARRGRLLGRLAPALMLALYVAATVVEGAGWADEATLWAKAIALDGRSAQAHRNLGVILLRRGQPAEALRHLEQARALGDDDANGARRRAMALEALGRVDEAAAEAALAVARGPEVAAAHAVFGAVLARQGYLAAAAREQARAAALDPTSPSTLLLEIDLASRRGDRAAVDAAEMRLIQFYPGEARFRFQRASTLLQAQDPTAADAARACLELAPDNPQCLCVLGRALVAAGQEASGREVLERAAPQLPLGDERTACEHAQHRARAIDRRSEPTDPTKERR